MPEVDIGPLVDRPQYSTPTKILSRPRKNSEEKITTAAKDISQSEEETPIDVVLSKVPVAIAIAKRVSEVDRESDRSDRDNSSLIADRELNQSDRSNNPPIVDRELDRSDQTLADNPIVVVTNELSTEGAAPENSIYYHESGDLLRKLKT